VSLHGVNDIFDDRQDLDKEMALEGQSRISDSIVSGVKVL
jgi:hypothetical protein